MCITRVESNPCPPTADVEVLPGHRDSGMERQRDCRQGEDTTVLHGTSHHRAHIDYPRRPACQR